MKLTQFLLLILALSFFSCSKDINTDATPGQELLSETDYLPGELLVQFRKGTDKSNALKTLENRKGRIIEYVYTKAMEQVNAEGFYVVKMEGDIQRSLHSLRSIPEVDHAEPNYIVHAPEFMEQRSSAAMLPAPAATEEISFPNDPYYPGQWNLRGPSSTPAEPFGTNADAIWQTGNLGSGDIHVALIGTGVFYEHEDLADNMWVNPNDPVDGVDNDGNGYVDDSRGWNFADRNNQVYDSRFTNEPNGARMASIIGAIGNNGKGVSGVCWNVKMIPLKIYNGGPSIPVSAFVQAIDYSTALKNSGINLVAINSHYETKKSTQLEASLLRANQANILFLSSAGLSNITNTGIDLNKKPVYPACYTLPNNITVTGLNQNGSLNNKANWGSKFVHLAAPGENLIVATDPLNDPFGVEGDGYNDHPFSWPAFAVAHVTAACVLYKAKHPNSTAEEIKSAILNSGLPTTSLSGKTITGKRLFLDPLVFGF
ncbi:S8 family serine peptidase [Flavihumibacter sp. ZG627]|uniref:S8 family serine peptidase n=1 Tax=Flavihumibacter sp. ZG627 TaxID=1463156 RepID=UPI000693972F|nr:S8 family serine peptidase [Flavihumibacter sp. ZG627]